MGRPTKLTPERESAILDALLQGNSRTTASKLAGIGEATLRDWIARYPRIRAMIENAEAQAEASHVANIATAAKSGTWQASAWWLERRRHADWGRIDRLELEIRRTADRVAAQTGADPDWLVKRALEIVEASERNAE